MRLAGLSYPSRKRFLCKTAVSDENPKQNRPNQISPNLTQFKNTSFKKQAF